MLDVNSSEFVHNTLHKTILWTIFLELVAHY